MASIRFTCKFVGDNVQKHKGVRDVRSDYPRPMIHMYSILTIKDRVSNPSLASTGSTLDLECMKPKEFTITMDDIDEIKIS